MTHKDFLDPITPGEILREDFMAPMEISINKLSRDLSVQVVSQWRQRSFKCRAWPQS